MLELYHWEPNAASARVLITLKEKGLEFQSRYVDVLRFEQHEPDFLKLNESGETPVLVRDGEAFNEASFICDYLDEAFPDVALMPTAPYDRWKARNWQKYVDDHLAAAVSALAWQAYSGAQMKDRNAAQAAVALIPARARRDEWTQALDGYPDDQLAKDRGRVETTVGLLEAELAGSDWLAGPGFSLADIAMFAFMNYLPKLTPELVNATTAPRTLAWLKRVSDRPAVQAASALARTPDPYAVAAPGPEHIRWG